MKTRKYLILLIVVFISTIVQAQDKNWGFEKKHQISTQAFIILTPILDPSPKFFQVNYGYRLSSKDQISIEAITWRFSGPLGRQYGSNYENPESDYPGDAKGLGLGLAYKRFIWKGAYAHFHSTAFHMDYRDHNEETIQTGFQLFNTIRIGYHLKAFKNRIFIAPSIAATFWPIYTNLPESFQVKEDDFGKYFLGEPGLHIGINF